MSCPFTYVIAFNNSHSICDNNAVSLKSELYSSLNSLESAQDFNSESKPQQRERELDKIFHVSLTDSCLKANDEGLVTFWSIDVLEYSLDNSIPFMNMLRKWNKICVSFDFEENIAQVAFNGLVSNISKPSFKSPNYNGTFDGNKISKAPQDKDLTLNFGMYFFDGNPFIGKIVNINAWDRTMSQEGINTTN